MCISTWQLHQEVAAQLILLGTLWGHVAVPRSRAAVVTLAAPGFRRYKGFGRSYAAKIDRFPRELPALAMRMKVMPAHSEIKVEHIPPDSLTGMRQDRRAIYQQRSVH